MTTIRPGISDPFLFAAGVEVIPEGEFSLRIPYYDWQGKLTGHNRWRLRNPLPDQKYHQLPNSGVQVYFSHIPLTKTDILYVTEGEFKTLSLLEAGYIALGLPGLHCYTHDDPDIPPVLLPGILEAIQLSACRRLCFVGDADTITNLEYFRSAGVLAGGIPQGILVELLQLPLDGPKGIDDLRESVNGEFPKRLVEMELGAFEVDPKKSFLIAAALCLETKGLLIHKLSPVLREHHIARVVRMAAQARLSNENRLAIERFNIIAQQVSGLNQKVFARSVEAVLNEIKEEEQGAKAEQTHGTKNQYYDAIKPSPVERPLGDIITEIREVTSQYIVTNSKNILLTSCWAVHTFVFKRSPYLPLLVFTGAEEDCGKSTYMRVVGRMSYRSFVLVATLSLHRVTQVYPGTYLLEESKALYENREMIAFLNAGFDNHSQHPVDSPILPRYDMEGRELLEFDPRFPKMCAGIGSYLERDTLSRSIIINMERFLPEEMARTKEYTEDIEQVTLPIYRALMTFWAAERQTEFGVRCKRVFNKFPSEFRSRNRQKFVPLLAVAELAGKELFEETLEAAVWKLNERDYGSPAIQHQLLCDVARVFFRQVLLYKKRIPDPATGRPSVILVQPKDVFLFPTLTIVELLLALPEAPWKSYGPKRQVLTPHALFDMLRVYDLHPEHLRIQKTTYRGLIFPVFCERYDRFSRIGDPTLESIAVELAQETKGTPGSAQPKDTPETDDSEGGAAKQSDTPSPSPSPGSKTIAQEAEAKSETDETEHNETGTSANDSAGSDNRNMFVHAETDFQSGTSGTPLGTVSQSGTCEVPLTSESAFENNLSGTSQTVTEKALITKVPAVPLKILVSAMNDVLPSIFTGLTSPWERPQDQLTETAQYFCSLLTHPSKWRAIDIETTAPPKLGKNKKPLKTNDALNPWLGSIRLMAINEGETLLQYDLRKGPLPQALLEVLAQSGWVAHNAEFELLYLRVHLGLRPVAVFCTQIANALLSNGLLHHTAEGEDETDISQEEASDKEKRKKAKKKKDTLNTLKRALMAQLGVDLPKELGNSDWAAESLSSEQLEYSRNDVLYLHSLASKQTQLLRENGLETVALLEMALLPVTTEMKRVGFAVDREKTAARAKEYTELTEQKRAYALSLLGEGCPKLGDSRKENGLLDWIWKKTGVRLPNLQENTLLGWEHPIGEAIVDYKRTAKRLAVFQAILKHSARDGKIHSTLNQTGAVTGRFSCREINVQQMERGPSLFRDLYIASGDDRCLVVADAKHIELRTGGICAFYQTGKNVLVDLFREGEKADPHAVTAADVISADPENVSKDDRQKSKAVNFGLLYGESAEGLRGYAKNTYGVIFTLEEADLFRRRWFKKYEDIAAWHKWAWDEITYGNPLESRTILGRRHLIPPGTGKWNVFQALINTPATGSAADFIKWCMVELARALPADCWLVMSVHDEVIVDVPRSKAQEIALLVKQVVENTFARLFDGIIPGPADVGYGPNWEAAKL